MEGTDTLVAVEVPEKDGNYLRTQLNKRIEAKGLEGIKVSVVNNVCYLERQWDSNHFFHITFFLASLKRAGDKGFFFSMVNLKR